MVARAPMAFRRVRVFARLARLEEGRPYPVS